MCYYLIKLDYCDSEKIRNLRRVFRYLNRIIELNSGNFQILKAMWIREKIIG